jgi:hypothetical protein
MEEGVSLLENDMRILAVKHSQQIDITGICRVQRPFFMTSYRSVEDNG